MTIANDIIVGVMPNFDLYLSEGESFDDIDEYGFTPLIECAIAGRLEIAEQLLLRKIDVNKIDVVGRTALHWAVDNNNYEIAELLLRYHADVNAYTTAGLSILVFPVLREQNELKSLLYRYGAKIDFAMDFINAKLLGHRFELKGYVDIVNAKSEFIELNYEGFIIEFTVAVVANSLKRFTSSYSTKHLREYFPYLHVIIDAFQVASELLQLQNYPILQNNHLERIKKLLQSPLLILPAASRGHALCFVRFNQWWGKIDRGENSLKEGSVNLYRITNPSAINVQFLCEFLYKKQPRKYFHQIINQQLGLVHVAQLPIAGQIVGNCSWANVQAVISVGYILQNLIDSNKFHYDQALILYDAWVEWDKDRALDECIQRFYLADPIRKASFAAILGAILFQSCHYDNNTHFMRVEKILQILLLPNYYYVLKSYIEIYCVQRLTRRGNNLLKLLDDFGIDPRKN